MAGTPRMQLPFLSPGQAQKEFFHNEALQTLDFVVCAAVEEPPRITPPANPIAGHCYIVGSAPSGVWAAAPVNAIAGFSDGGWRYISPVEGMSAYVKSSGIWANFRAGAWELGNLRAAKLTVAGDQVVGARGAAIASPSGGSAIDAQARTAIDQILAALRTHGLIAS